MDKIVKVAVTFSDGKKEMTRVYTTISDTTFIKANNPQAKNPGYIEVKGQVSAYEDIDAPIPE